MTVSSHQSTGIVSQRSFSDLKVPTAGWRAIETATSKFYGTINIYCILASQTTPDTLASYYTATWLEAKFGAKSRNGHPKLPLFPLFCLLRGSGWRLARFLTSQVEICKNLTAPVKLFSHFWLQPRLLLTMAFGRSPLSSCDTQPSYACPCSNW